MRDERKSPRGIFVLTDGTPDGRLASGADAGPLTDSQNNQSRGQPSIFKVCVVVSISVAAHLLAAVPMAGQSLQRANTREDVLKKRILKDRKWRASQTQRLG